MRPPVIFDDADLALMQAQPIEYQNLISIAFRQREVAK